MPANDATDLIHYTHEHDLKLGHTHLESNKKRLTCSLCDISYCESCGKELSIHEFCLC
jgi:hypothetical protein